MISRTFPQQNTPTIGWLSEASDLSLLIPYLSCIYQNYFSMLPHLLFSSFMAYFIMFYVAHFFVNLLCTSVHHLALNKAFTLESHDLNDLVGHSIFSKKS